MKTTNKFTITYTNEINERFVETTSTLREALGWVANFRLEELTDAEWNLAVEDVKILNRANIISANGLIATITK
jgi:hypothetical protein